MHRTILTSCVLFLVLVVNAQKPSATSEDSIRHIIMNQQTAWNDNRMQDFCSFFTSDATLINFLGMKWESRAEIIQRFAAINDCCIKPTSVSFSITGIRFLQENIAIAYVSETLLAREDYQVPGKTVKKGETDHKIWSAVFIRKEGKWQIASLQVTQNNPLLAAPPKAG
jgi:uncharacterized protein (TIGR02246 family)